jgi:hypothetical protein
MQPSVKQRLVLYVAGFDPSGPAHYHRLYKEHATRQGALKGYQIEVGPRRKHSEHLATWSVTHSPTGDQETNSTHTDYLFARWDDIVRTHWQQMNSFSSTCRLASSFLATQWHYLRTGALWHMLCLAWPPVVALVSPLALLLVVLLLWLAAPWAISAGLSMLGLTGTLAQGAVHSGLIVAAWALVSLGLAWAVRKLEDKFHMLWLMRSYIFTRSQALGHVPEVDDRLRAFAVAIAQARDSGKYDEVLVVGHSSGCILAVSALAQSLSIPPAQNIANAQGKPVHSTAIGLLTLGHWLPLLSSLPAAQEFRAQLQCISNHGALYWVDFAAPADGCCFAFVDAVAAAVPESERGACVPKLLSPRFQTLFNEADYRALCSHRFDLHFQYIKAAPLPGDYDYFAITAGDLALSARFASLESVRNFTKFRLFG